jgi:hypothetical protein
MDAGFKIIPVGLLVGHAIRQIPLPSILYIRDACFGIKEIIIVVYDQGGIIPEAVDIMFYMPVLQIIEIIPVGRK